MGGERAEPGAPFAPVLLAAEQLAAQGAAETSVAVVRRRPGECGQGQRASDPERSGAGGLEVRP